VTLCIHSSFIERIAAKYLSLSAGFTM
jgi:hypothetical protein